MQIHYNKKNISLRFWSWCIQKRFTPNGLIIKNNITDKTFYIELLNQNAIDLDRLLSKGISVDNFISKLNSYGVNGTEWYISFMQNGIIE